MQRKLLLIPTFKQVTYGCFILLILLSSCSSRPTLFVKLPSEKTGIHFNNAITENDSINPIDLEFLYNGGGVAVGDFNNDGLPDLYFTASTVANKLYLNKGGLQFSDITAASGTGGKGRWCNAASVVDINNDGLPDIYVCATIHKNPAERSNILYVNQGLNKDGIPVFKDMAEEYGLADTSYSVHAAFFDYDNDGDLDMYLVTTRLVKRESASFSNNTALAQHEDIDKLFRNDWSDSLHHPVFTDVSKEAGIVDNGFGLGVAIADINLDGWKDIYVTNDFFGNDVLYINNKNGTFTNKAKEYLKHTSQNAMGNDICDINNDGLADIITVDMNPEDNYRKKKNMSGVNYYIYQNMVYQNMLLQYVRNTVQLNMGNTTGYDDSLSHPVFGDISFYTGMAETDWSWSPLIADVNNDGNRDVLITNGYPRDVTDHDFTSFRNQSGTIASKKQLIAEIPVIKTPNYGFKNNGGLQFENASKNWGLNDPSFSNGAVYADLDNDGDLDYVVNNINDEAFVYENSSIDKKRDDVNFLEINFRGDSNNLNGIGAWARIYYGGNQRQVYENSPYRGYLSTIAANAFFGLGRQKIIDSVVIIWPNNKKQKLTNVPVNQLLTVDIHQAAETYSWETEILDKAALFTNITRSAGIDYIHHEPDYIDFDKERLLPHKLSQYGPGLAAGDIDGNGFDDIVVGGTGNYPGSYFLQQPGGHFVQKALSSFPGNVNDRPENMGLLLFDADGDGDLDLYCASGSNEFSANAKNYKDQLYLNDGRGNFTPDTTAVMPVNFTSKSCVKAFDYDNDGDLDLFIGGRCLPGKYPLPVSSFIYRNDSKNGKVIFTDVSAEIAPSLKDIGMVCDAQWTDFDNDGNVDLVLAGEWMPVTFLKNNYGKFENVTALSGVATQFGWWNSIVAGDFDNDGKMDYIVSNLGQNSFFRASGDYPVRVYAKDFDGNGSIDPIITAYFPDQQGIKKEYTVFNRDDIVGQLPGLRKNFQTYKEFANAEFNKLFTEDQMKNALVLQANNFKTCLLKNMGNGKFELHPLPLEAQQSPVFGMVTGDFNDDGNLDLVLNGNDYGNEPGDGRYDAMNGLLLFGDGKGNFIPRPTAASGIYIPGDGKAIITLKGPENSLLIAASQNRGPLLLFKRKAPYSQFVSLLNHDKVAYITLKSGAVRKEELSFGTSFLSQSARFLPLSENVKSVVIVNDKGMKRTVQQ